MHEAERNSRFGASAAGLFGDDHEEKHQALRERFEDFAEDLDAAIPDCARKVSVFRALEDVARYAHEAMGSLSTPIFRQTMVSFREGVVQKPYRVKDGSLEETPDEPLTNSSPGWDTDKKEEFDISTGNPVPVRFGQNGPVIGSVTHSELREGVFNISMKLDHPLADSLFSASIKNGFSIAKGFKTPNEDLRKFEENFHASIKNEVGSQESEKPES